MWILLLFHLPTGSRKYFQGRVAVYLILKPPSVPLMSVSKEINSDSLLDMTILSHGGGPQNVPSSGAES